MRKILTSILFMCATTFAMILPDPNTTLGRAFTQASFGGAFMQTPSTQRVSEHEASSDQRASSDLSNTNQRNTDPIGFIDISRRSDLNRGFFCGSYIPYIMSEQIGNRTHETGHLFIPNSLVGVHLTPTLTPTPFFNVHVAITNSVNELEELRS